MVRLPAGSARRAELPALILVAVALLIGAVLYTELLVTAWYRGASGRQLVVALSRQSPIGINAWVVGPAGVVAGWLVVFLFDRSKKLQAVLLAFAAAPFLAVVRGSGAWGTGVWLTSWPWFFPGLAVGVATAVGTSRLLTDHHIREFPGAVGLLTVTAVVVAVVGVYDAHLTRATALGEMLRHGGGSAMFLAVLVVFVQYQDRDDVLVVAPDDGTSATTVLAALYDHVDGRTGTAVVRDRRLTRAVATLRQTGTSDRWGDGVELSYRPAGAFGRWVSVRGRRVDISRTPLGGAVRTLHPDRSGPLWAGFFDTGVDEFTGAVGRSRAVVLVLPGTWLDNDSTASGVADTVDGYRKLCRAGRRSDTEVVVVVTGQPSPNDPPRLTDQVERLTDGEIDCAVVGVGVDDGTVVGADTVYEAVTPR